MKKVIVAIALMLSVIGAASAQETTGDLYHGLTDRLVLLINARERIMWGSSIGHFHTQFGVDLKFIIN